jgi:putative ABC transport system permease protein
MRAAAGVPVVAAGVARRRVQTVVIILVLLIATTACVLAVALAVDSSGPFDKAFAAQHGADVTITADTARVTAAQLAATARLPQITAAAGPFAEVTVRASVSGGRCRSPRRWPGARRLAAPSMTSRCGRATGRGSPARSSWAAPGPAAPSSSRSAPRSR